MKNLSWIILVLALWLAAQPQQQHRLADGMQRKLDYIQQNGAKAQPDQRPTVLTEAEINDYFAAGEIKMPQGVKKVTLQGNTGVVTGLATVDFDELRAGQHSNNPMLSIFSGTHDVKVEADGVGSGGIAKIHVRSVALDGYEVPRFALELFVSRYLKPKYPNVGLDSQFQMPDRVDTATVGSHKLTLTQK